MVINIFGALGDLRPSELEYIYVVMAVKIAGYVGLVPSERQKVTNFSYP